MGLQRILLPCLVLLCGPGAASGLHRPAVPKITFTHSGLLEVYCGRVSPWKPDPAAMAELDRRLPEFTNIWEAEGPRLLAESARLTQMPYRFAESVATLHACPDMPSPSAPLAIAAARYTVAAGGGAESGLVSKLKPGDAVPKLPPQPLSDFVYTVWHEATHRYVQDIVDARGGTTPLLAKYAAEPRVVLHHLHLLALERLVWRAIGREAESRRREQEDLAKGYKLNVRAWSIVEQEGPEAFLRELRPVGPRGRNRN
jgi:hypothetical protein